jgi:hypothetical protein
MQPAEEHRVRAVAVRAAWTLEELADDLPYAAPVDREALRAGIDFERWLLESCLAVLPAAPPSRNDPF